jgi:hypothetical protein
MNKTGVVETFLVRDKTLKSKAEKGFMEIANLPMKPYELGYSTAANFAARFGMAGGTLKLKSDVPHGAIRVKTVNLVLVEPTSP